MFQNLSLIKEKKNTRGKKRKKVRKYNSKAEQNFSVRARQDRARARVARRKREFVYLYKVCVKSKDFPLNQSKKCQKYLRRLHFLILQNITLYKNHVFLTFNKSLLLPLPPTEEEDAPMPPPVFPPPAMMIPLSGSPPLAETPPLAEAEEEE